VFSLFIFPKTCIKCAYMCLLRVVERYRRMVRRKHQRHWPLDLDLTLFSPMGFIMQTHTLKTFLSNL
jgi:hypothetical protein